jgi:hypothetical protein
VYEISPSNISDEGKRRRQWDFSCSALLAPKDSAWETLFDLNDDGALIMVTGFDYRAFNAMHELFNPLSDEYSPWTEDNPGFYYKKVNRDTKGGSFRIISSMQCLGLVLGWFQV